MSKIVLNGNWTGFYKYGGGYPDSLKSEEFYFEGTIGQEGTSFIGRIRIEKNEVGKTDTLPIKGTLIDNRIIFTMHNGKTYLLNENGTVNPVAIEKDIVLYYRGQFYPEESRFKGNWEDPDSGGAGTWEMWHKPNS